MILDLTISLPVHACTIVNPQPSIVNGVAFLYNCCFGSRTRLSEKMRLLGHANNKFGETPEIVAPAAASAFLKVRRRTPSQHQACPLRLSPLNDGNVIFPLRALKLL